MSERSREGQTLAGKYALEARLRAGTIDETYRAKNTAMDRVVTIRVLLPEQARDRAMVERFLAEARTANLVRHPNVVDVLDVGRDEGGVPFLVEEMLEGEGLRERLAAAGGRLGYQDALALIAPIVDALGLAHARGVVHGNLSPDDMFLARIGGVVVPKLTDFGEATSGPASPYASPEQLQGAEHIDARSDVWSLGVVLFETLAGRRPFEATSPSELAVRIAVSDPPSLEAAVTDLPLDLSRVVARCLRKDRARRYPTANELHRDLCHVLEGKAILSEAERVMNPAAAPSGPTPTLATEKTQAPKADRALVSAKPTVPLTDAATAGPWDPDEVPSGIAFARTAPHEGRFANVRRASSRPPQSRRDSRAFRRAAILALVMLAVTGLLAAAEPVPSARVFDAVARTFAHLPGAVLLVVAVGALVVAAACGVSGVRAVPPSIGPLTSGAGLLALAALLALHVGVESASPPIAFAIALALVPFGAALYAWRLAWRAFREDSPSRRAVGIAIASAGSLGLFVAGEILRASP